MRTLRSALRIAARSQAVALSTAAAAPPAMPRVAVVGGGVAGLSAAKSLLRHDVAVTLIDMGGRGPGGRVASRQLEVDSAHSSSSSSQKQLSFDHGAQFFTAGSPEFQAQLAEWQQVGVADEWRGRHGRIAADGSLQLFGTSQQRQQQQQPFGGSSGTSSSGGGFFGSTTGQPLWVGVPTNHAVCEHMAQALVSQQQQGEQPRFQLLSGCLVQAIERADAGGCGGGCGGGAGVRWRLRGSRKGRGAAGAAAAAAGGGSASEQAGQEDLGSYDAVVLADGMPLLPGSAGRAEGLEGASSSLAQLARSVQAVAPQPCFALMLAFEQPLPGVPFDSAAVDWAGDAHEGGIQSASGSSTASSSSGVGGAFQWVACNSSKPGRPGSDGSSGGGGAPQCWVALTTPQRAQQLLAEHPLVKPGGSFNPQTRQYQADVAAQLLADFRRLMQPFVQGPLSEPLYCHSQRWGRAFVPEPLGAQFLFLPAQRLALCGDVAAGSGLEAAWHSGRAAGEAVGRMLGSLPASSQRPAAL